MDDIDDLLGVGDSVDRVEVMEAILGLGDSGDLTEGRELLLFDVFVANFEETVDFFVDAVLDDRTDDLEVRQETSSFTRE